MIISIKTSGPGFLPLVFLLFKQLMIIFLSEDCAKRWLNPPERDWLQSLQFAAPPPPPPQPTQTLTRVRVKAWQASTACPACLRRSAARLLGTPTQRDLTARGPLTGCSLTQNSRYASIAKMFFTPFLWLHVICDHTGGSLRSKHPRWLAPYLSLSTAPSAPGGAIDSWKGVLK